MECDEVTDDQYRTNREEDSSGSKTKFQPEQNREDQRHPDERSISRHHDVFLNAAQSTRHLNGRRKKHASIEPKNMESATQTGVGRYSLKYMILGRCSAILSLLYFDCA